MPRDPLLGTLLLGALLLRISFREGLAVVSPLPIPGRPPDPLSEFSPVSPDLPRLAHPFSPFPRGIAPFLTRYPGRDPARSPDPAVPAAFSASPSSLPPLSIGAPHSLRSTRGLCLYYIYCIRPVWAKKTHFFQKNMRKYLQVQKKSLPLHPHLRNRGSSKYSEGLQ